MKLDLLKEFIETQNTVRCDLPLFIRMLEWAREDAVEDVDLHVLAENAIDLMTAKTALTMADYEALLKNTGKKK
jgi:hypothetical protein